MRTTETSCHPTDSTLKAAPVRISHPDVPIPFARNLEDALLPNADKIEAAITKMMELPNGG
ncbi:hypothetical protein [Parasphingopyxis marina]|uniref:Uncharacterized protein n=1 Tax=Parasphingopyxis marina TaxID=2761622 RepID=A0A842HUL4_9SPHN|nr:hypothetical protein [Parasphingopyxis marina]MBC2776625.1 hypothetical protein [Parasphingopyxis marina]